MSNKQEKADRDRPYLTKRNGTYEIKVRTCGGMLDISQLETLRDIATDCGCGEVHLTSRQEVLLLEIKEQYIKDALKRLEKAGLKGGSAGLRVRNIAACIGERCKNCFHDTTGIARELDKKYGEMPLPGAVKINIACCAFPCTRPQFADIGIIGRTKPKVDMEKCDGCGKCAEKCLMKAITINAYKKAEINSGKCKKCGRCIQNCPISAIGAEEKGFIIFLGGRGSWPAFTGEILDDMVKIEDVVPLVGKILDYYNKNALPEEKRLRPFVKRIGIEKLKEDLLT
jgi:dissimilatory sulfite reductase (desulfoviridin) alpha/beta subunit